MITIGVITVSSIMMRVIVVEMMVIITLAIAEEKMANTLLGLGILLAIIAA
jgi:hypothetical protein